MSNKRKNILSFILKAKIFTSGCPDTVVKLESLTVRKRNQRFNERNNLEGRIRKKKISFVK